MRHPREPGLEIQPKISTPAASLASPHLTLLFSSLRQFPDGRQHPTSLVLPLWQILPGAQPLCGPLAVLRHHAGRQKATLPWDTLHYPHHHCQPEPSSGQYEPRDTLILSVPAHRTSCHAGRASEPQQLLGTVTVPAKGLTAAWTQQWAGQDRKNRAMAAWDSRHRRHKYLLSSAHSSRIKCL